MNFNDSIMEDPTFQGDSLMVNQPPSYQSRSNLHSNYMNDGASNRSVSELHFSANHVNDVSLSA